MDGVYSILVYIYSNVPVVRYVHSLTGSATVSVSASVVETAGGGGEAATDLLLHIADMV